MGTENEKSGPSTAQRLHGSASRGALFWIAWIVAILGALAAVITAGLVVADALSSEKDAEVSICREINATMQQLRGAQPDDGVPFAELRRALTGYGARTTPGSGLSAGIEEWIEALDHAQALASAPFSRKGDLSATFLALMSASEVAAEACDGLGVRFTGFRAYEGADGSISDRDAHAFCEAELALLQYAARAELNDEHLWNLVVVANNRAFKGLPIEIYSSHISIITMLIVALEGEGYPEAELGARAIAEYCRQMGAGEGWPDLG